MKRNFSGWGVITAGLLLAVGGVLAMWSGWDMILLERGWSLFIAGAVALSGGVVTIALGRVIAALTKALEARPVVAAAPTGEPAVAAPAAPVLAPAPVAATPPAAQSVPPSPPPIAERPISKPPVFEEPVFEEPVQGKPVAKEPMAEPVVERSITEDVRPPVLRQSYGYARGFPPLRRADPPPAPDVAKLSPDVAKLAPDVVKPAPTEVDRYTSGDSTYVMMSDGSVEVRGPNRVKRYASLSELKAETAAQAR